MTLGGWNYRYVGPAELRSLVRRDGEGQSVRSPTDFDAWVSARTAEELAEPFTFVVDEAGVLRLAPRRREHVVCAGGEAVLSAGEISFREESGRWAVDEVSNQSTGYCPDISSWSAVAEALDQAGIVRPSGFTHEVVFRRCLSCRQLNIVREEHFVCVFCDEALPRQWNVDQSERQAVGGLPVASATARTGARVPSRVGWRGRSRLTP
ncbi:hypothetical protein [Streptomyces sediminimaris]|uniref:hypothetical protein n=1 Tax=Streptomyces sediminimaris TaxID=3383721 RepID=UPI003999A445